MHDLGAATGLVDQRAQEFAHDHIVPGFLQHLPSGGSTRRFAGIELALWQHPFVALAKAHDRNARRQLPPQHDPTRRQHLHPCHFPIPVPFEFRVAVL
jgi:hypothetical protein